MEMAFTITYYFQSFFSSVCGSSAYETHRKLFKYSELKNVFNIRSILHF